MSYKEYPIRDVVAALLSVLESKGVLEKREVLNLLDKIEAKEK